VSLNKVAGIEESRGDLDAAHAKYVESLEIRRGLAEELGTPWSLRDVSRSLDNVAGIEESRGDLDAAHAKYVESLEIRRGLAEELGTPGSLRDVSVSLNSVGRILEARSDWPGALERYEESLGIRRRLLEEFGEPLPQWISDFQWSLNRVRDVAIEAGAFDRAHELADERIDRAVEEVGEDRSPRACEYLLSLLNPVFRCELELGRLEDAAESARFVEGFVGLLIAAFEDDTVDRAKEALDSTTLFRCADGMELVARLRGLQGDEPKREEAAETAKSLRESAEQLKAEEDAATDEESSQ
jgi:hypothetical protein